MKKLPLNVKEQRELANGAKKTPEALAREVQTAFAALSIHCTRHWFPGDNIQLTYILRLGMRVGATLEDTELKIRNAVKAAGWKLIRGKFGVTAKYDNFREYHVACGDMTRIICPFGTATKAYLSIELA